MNAKEVTGDLIYRMTIAVRSRLRCSLMLVTTDSYSNIIIQLMDLFHAALAAPAADVGAEESPNLNF